MNTQKYLDGFMRCAKDAHVGGHPETCLVATLNRDYAAGWDDALASVSLFRCMKQEIFDVYAEECARYSLALRSDTVRGCERCGGRGYVRFMSADNSDEMDCVCLGMALDDITQELGF